jgi:Tfp pilus assembly protein PilX
MKQPTTNNRKPTTESGIALYMAITITSAIVLVAFAIISLALRQISISNAGRDSQVAFYAADAGSECALYWDAKNTGGSAFASTTSSTQISCNQDSTSNPTNPVATPVYVGASNTNIFGPWTPATATSTFAITFKSSLSDTSFPCAIVTVYKGNVGSGTVVTKIESRGYNTCDPSSIRRVERAIRINY